MTLAAIEKGFVTLGFSGHSPMYYEADWTMPKEKVSEYIKDIRRVKEKYADKIDVLCGIELGQGAQYPKEAELALRDYPYVFQPLKT